MLLLKLKLVLLEICVILFAVCHVFNLFTASYFVNWSYQNSKACTVLVGESTEKFSASKATTLEASNKSLVRPHQTSPSAGSGNEENHSRHRRSVDVEGHASVQSLSSMDSSTAVDNMHDITTPLITTSLVHGVVTENNKQVSEDDGGANAFVYANVLANNTGDLITKVTESPNELFNIITTISSEKIVNKDTKSKNQILKKPVESHVEVPVEVIKPKRKHITTNFDKSNIAYDPKDMQGDSFPSIYTYGILKYQYLQELSRLNKATEELHIYSNDSDDIEKSKEKFQYENEPATTSKVETTLAKIVTNTVASTETSVTTKPTGVIATTNMFASLRENILTTTPTPIVAVFTNNNVLPKTSTTPETTTMTNITSTTEEIVPSTVNMFETKPPDVTNPKHVLINLTISADDENSSYKPLYSLTVRVPTVGDSNELPTVRITPMDVEPTQATNFNKPVTLENTTQPDIKDRYSKTNEPYNPEDLGGSCECSCPTCDKNTTDDFYEDEFTTASTDPETRTSDYNTMKTTLITEATTEDITETIISNDVSTESVSTTDEYSDITSDSTTETDSISSTTKLPQLVCPKVKPPPILILEGEVELTIRNNLLTITGFHQRLGFPYNTTNSLTCMPIWILGLYCCRLSMWLI